MYQYPAFFVVLVKYVTQVPLVRYIYMNFCPPFENDKLQLHTVECFHVSVSLLVLVNAFNSGTSLVLEVSVK